MREREAYFVGNTMRFLCSECRGEVAVPAAAGGRKTNCPHCGEQVKAPDLVPSEAVHAPAPPKRWGPAPNAGVVIVAILALCGLILFVIWAVTRGGSP